VVSTTLLAEARSLVDDPAWMFEVSESWEVAFVVWARSVALVIFAEAVELARALVVMAPMSGAETLT
jgi:hypothetical protein